MLLQHGMYYRHANKASCCCCPLLVTLCNVNALNTQRHRLTIYENRPIIERKLKDVIYSFVRKIQRDIKPGLP